MGTILHEGEYILISGKITVETQFIGYSILSHIGINTSKVNYIGSTRHFLTYAVIEDLELPFDNYTWHKFEIKDTIFHPYHRHGHHLFLLHHDEERLKYRDEIEAFIQSKEKEKNKMVLKKENYIYTAVTTWSYTDETLMAAILGFLPDDKETHMISGSEGRILWSKTKLSNDTYYSAIDASVRLHKLSDELDFTVTNYGDIIIYRTTNCSFTPQEVLDSYNRYISSKFFIREENKEDKKDEPTLNTDSSFSLHCKPFITMPRNLGRSQAMSMLNSVYGLNPKFQGGLCWDLWDTRFKLYFGVERATGKQKTVCIWKDGEKTIIRGDKSVLSMPVQYAVAWCYVKRRFKTTSQFKKYVDNHSHILDGITYFEGDARGKMAQASVNNRTKKYDIYDAAALAITAKHYGSVKTIMNYCDGWGE